MHMQNIIGIVTIIVLMVIITIIMQHIIIILSIEENQDIEQEPVQMLE